MDHTNGIGEFAAELAALRAALAQAQAERDAATSRAEQAEAVVSKLAEAVIWMSGSDDFSDNGKAHAGWVTIRDGALAAALAGPEGGPR